jgi:hypothetical protein
MGLAFFVVDFFHHEARRTGVTRDVLVFLSALFS